ncbi:MAG: hypothetical protein AAGB04_01150 [Pseudomonadota bacterium]
MVGPPIYWQHRIFSDFESAVRCGRPLLTLLFAFYCAPAIAQVSERRPDSRLPASSATGEALQLYRNCVVRGSLSACDSLIEGSKKPGFTNSYSLAAAYYKRGSVKAKQERLKAALVDYKKAASLFPFPQLDLEIERIEKQVRGSRGADRTASSSISRKGAQSKPVIRRVLKADAPPDFRKKIKRSKPIIKRVVEAELPPALQGKAARSKSIIKRVVEAEVPEDLPQQAKRPSAIVRPVRPAKAPKDFEQAKPRPATAAKNVNTEDVATDIPEREVKPVPIKSRIAKADLSTAPAPKQKGDVVDQGQPARQAPKQIQQEKTQKESKTANVDVQPRPIKSAKTVAPQSTRPLSGIISVTEPWETITERVIHRYRVKIARPPEPPVTQIFAELRGTCDPETGASCAPTANEELGVIDEAGFERALEQQVAFGQFKPLPGSAVSTLTTGSLPSFQVMSGIRPAPEPAAERGPPVARVSPAVLKATKDGPFEMTVTAQSVKVSMIARPALVSEPKKPRSAWSPSLLHYLVFLIIASATAGMLVMHRRRLGQLADDFGRAGLDRISVDHLSKLWQVRNVAKASAPATQSPVDLVERSVEREIDHSPAQHSPQPPPIPVQPVNEDLGHTHGGGHDVVGIDFPVGADGCAINQDETATLIATALGDADTGAQTQSDASNTGAEGSAAGLNLLENVSLAGSVLIVASDDDKRQRILRSTMRAISNNTAASLHPMIALDGTGLLKDLLSHDEQFKSDASIIDWRRPDVAGALNPFLVLDIDREPLAREQALNKAFEMQCHICEGFLGVETVAQSRSQLRHLFRLMSIMPKADFTTLRELLVQRETDPFKEHIEKLSSKSSEAFFRSEFQSRAFAKLAEKITPLLDELLSDEILANAILEPRKKSRKTSKARENSLINVIPVPKAGMSSMASSVMRRICLARVMQHWPLRSKYTAAPSSTTLVIDTLSQFELPDILGFNQVLREYLQSGGNVIACISEPGQLPSGDFELIARCCSNKIIDGSLSSQMQSLSGDLGIESAIAEESRWDGTEEQAMLIRSGEQGEEATLVNYS